MKFGHWVIDFDRFYSVIRIYQFLNCGTLARLSIVALILSFPPPLALSLFSIIILILPPSLSLFSIVLIPPPPLSVSLFNRRSNSPPPPRSLSLFSIVVLILSPSCSLSLFNRCSDSLPLSLSLSPSLPPHDKLMTDD